MMGIFLHLLKFPHPPVTVWKYWNFMFLILQHRCWASPDKMLHVFLKCCQQVDSRPRASQIENTPNPEMHLSIKTSVLGKLCWKNSKRDLVENGGIWQTGCQKSSTNKLVWKATHEMGVNHDVAIDAKTERKMVWISARQDGQILWKLLVTCKLGFGDGDIDGETCGQQGENEMLELSNSPS